MTKTLNLRCLMIPFLILLMGSYLFGVVLPPLNGHAVERHAGQAVRAWKYVRDNGGPGDKWDCKDGRVRWVCALKNDEGKRLFAVVVIAGSTLVTAFICNQHYAASIKDQGHNDWYIGNGHP